MPQVRSARGDVVDFQLLQIKQQLAAAPAPKTVDERRRFIDEKDGVRTVKEVEQPVEQVDALALALEAADTSEKAAAKKSK
mgnify:CR=1 FL=1